MKIISKDEKLEYDIITTIYDISFIECKGYKKYNDIEKPVSFNDLIEEFNLDKSQSYIIICENPLEGIVLRYGNYRDGKLWLVGETKGYA